MSNTNNQMEHVSNVQSIKTRKRKLNQFFCVLRCDAEIVLFILILCFFSDSENEFVLVIARRIWLKFKCSMLKISAQNMQMDFIFKLLPENVRATYCV